MARQGANRQDRAKTGGNLSRQRAAGEFDVKRPTLQYIAAYGRQMRVADGLSQLHDRRTGGKMPAMPR